MEVGVGTEEEEGEEVIDCRISMTVKWKASLFHLKKRVSAVYFICIYFL